jgi:sugar O-acyltransferase (sialic acid O-acetyltransferase NeuD family)
MKDFAIFGAGGFGREVYCSIRNAGFNTYGWNFLGFFDDGIPPGTIISSYGKVLGNTETLRSWEKPLSLLFAIGDASIIEKIVLKTSNPLIEYPNYISSVTSFADKESISYGKGNLIIGDCHISCNVQLGDFNIMNSGVRLGHDVEIGSYNTIMPGTRISGEVLIGDFNFFGLCSIVLQHINIKNHTKIGAGSVLLTSPKAGELYLGNPARIFIYK